MSLYVPPLTQAKKASSVQLTARTNSLGIRDNINYILYIVYASKIRRRMAETDRMWTRAYTLCAIYTK